MSAALDYKNYLRVQLKGLGLTEHKDAFWSDNNENTNIDESFHIEMGVGGYEINEMSDIISYGLPGTVRIFLDGGADPQDAVDQALDLSETVTSKILANDVRYGGINKKIQRVKLSSIVFQPLEATNDNIIVIVFSFVAEINLDLNC